MEGKTHAAVGAAVAAGCMVVMPNTLSGGAVSAGFGVVAAVVGALFPDLDVHNSMGDKLLKHVMKIIAIAALAAIVVEVTRAMNGGDGVTTVKFGSKMAAIIIFFGIAFFTRTQPHRGFSHSIVAMSATTLCVFVGVSGNYWLWYSLGYASHLLIDMLNTKGESLLWPAPGKFALYLCKADGVANKALFYVGVFATAVALWCREGDGLLSMLQ